MSLLLSLKAKMREVREQWKKKREEHKRRRVVETDIRKRLKQKRSVYRLKPYLDRAGLTIDASRLSRYFFNVCVVINLLISAYLIYYYCSNFGYSLYYVLFVMALVWTLLFLGLLFVVWFLFHLVLDLRIFERKVTIEEVLPDFLELTSANIRAGMPIDRALWFAVRPKFGVLAKEIEIVAKQTMSGEDLEKALQNFAAKYDSLTLKRSVNLLVEGIKAGGEIGDLLNKISIHIKESQLLKKEMSANVTSYVIFIGFATMIAAPALFGLSYQLLGNIHDITSKIDMPKTSPIGLTFGKVGITMQDFSIFAYSSLLVTSFFSAVLVATIKKGTIRAGFRYIPIFMITSIVVFKLSSLLMARLFGNLL